MLHAFIARFDVTGDELEPPPPVPKASKRGCIGRPARNGKVPEHEQNKSEWEEGGD